MTKIASKGSCLEAGVDRLHFFLHRSLFSVGAYLVGVIWHKNKSEDRKSNVKIGSATAHFMAIKHPNPLNMPQFGLLLWRIDFSCITFVLLRNSKKAECL